jgi:hypothetical protein
LGCLLWVTGYLNSHTPVSQKLSILWQNVLFIVDQQDFSWTADKWKIWSPLAHGRACPLQVRPANLTGMSLLTSSPRLNRRGA